MLSGYLQLFLILQIINLVLTAGGFLVNASLFFALISSGGATATYTLAYLCLILIDVLLNSLVIYLFIAKNKTFIKMYIVSAVFKIILSCLMLTLFSPMFDTGFFNIAMTLLGIILNGVMLYFWLNFFKTSIVLKAYLKKNSSSRKLSRKAARARRKFKVIK